MLNLISGLQPVQCKVAKAGAEIEAKGVHITGEDDKELPKQLEIVSNPKIVVDTGNLEYVSKPETNTANFFNNIEEGRRKLVYFENRVRGLHDDKKHVTWQGDGPKFNLRKMPGKENLAKPQVTVEIQRGHLHEFSTRIAANETRYRKGRDSQGTLFQNFDVSIYKEATAALIKQGFEEIDHCEGNENIKALAKMVWQMTVSAYSNYPAAYYKARFPIMARTSYRKTYNRLSEDEKKQYGKIIKALQNSFFVSSTKERKELCGTKIKNFAFDRFQENSAIESRREMPMLNALNSVHSGPGYVKTRGEEEVRVEALASDEMASRGDVGASLGAYGLPAEADGIFEIRGMPYIHIDTAEEVRQVYEDVLKHYSGEENDYIGPNG